MDKNVDCYEGGIPNQGFSGTYPKEAAQGTMFQPDPTKGEVDTENGGPAKFKGSSNEGVLNEAGYAPEGEIRPGGLKVVDLDDIKSSV